MLTEMKCSFILNLVMADQTMEDGPSGWEGSLICCRKDVAGKDKQSRKQFVCGAFIMKVEGGNGNIGVFCCEEKQIR